MRTRIAALALAAACVACSTTPASIVAIATVTPPLTSASAGGRTDAALWREDLRFFAQAMPRTHLNLFHSTSRATWEEAIAALDAKLDALNAVQFEVELLRLVALTKDGHTQIQTPFAGTDLVAAFHEFPMVLYSYSDGIFVQVAAPGLERFSGARLVAIDGTPISTAVDRVAPLIDRDSDAMLPWYTARYLVVPEIDQAVGIIASIEHASFTFEVGGTIQTVELQAQPISSHAGWIDARAAASAPTPRYLQDSGNSYWASRIGDQAMYVQWNVVLPKIGSDESIFGFFTRVMQQIDARPVEKLIIDVRFNQGGERFYVDPVVQMIQARPAVNTTGALFVITGRRTFSSGVVFCALMQKRTHVLFVGEPASSRPNQYATVARLTLPNTKLVIGASTQFNQDVDPGDERPWIAPDVSVTLSSRDYAANADPVLAAVLTWRPK